MKRFRKSVIGVLAALLLMSFVVPGATAVEPMADAVVGSPLAPAAATADGWKQNNGNWYYYENEVMATGWKMVGGAWYYFHSSGVMATGWLQVGSTWYYFHSSGAMATGWLQVGSTWYYFYPDGAMATNARIPMAGGGERGDYVDVSGAMVTNAWVLMDDTWYYYGDDGLPVTGWKEVGGTWYYFRPSGNMATGWTLTDYDVSWHYFDENGHWISSLGACPSWAPVKGNKNGVTYHLPEQWSYNHAMAKVCFGTAADAEGQGFQLAEE